MTKGPPCSVSQQSGSALRLLPCFLPRGPADPACLPSLRSQARVCCHRVLRQNLSDQCWAVQAPGLFTADTGRPASQPAGPCLWSPLSGHPMWPQVCHSLPRSRFWPASGAGFAGPASEVRVKGPGLGVGAGVLPISPVPVFPSRSSLSALRKMIKGVKSVPPSRPDTSCS